MVNKICIECEREFNLNNYYFKPNPKAHDGFSKKCRECQNNIKIFTDDTHKYCTQCQNLLPKNRNYFDIKKVNYDGFNARCKVCCGYSYVKEMPPTKQGFKYCIKCERELENNARFFPPDKTTKGGFRNVCRECGKDGHFMVENYEPIENWSKEETKLFIDRYPHYTNAELIEIFYHDKTEKSLWDKAYRHNIVKSEETYLRGRKIQAEKLYGINSPLYGLIRSDETKLKNSIAISERYKLNGSWLKGKSKSGDMRRHMSLIKTKLGKWKGKNNPRYLNPLKESENPNWKGGITPLSFWLRNQLGDWKKDSMESCNYKCVMTGKNFDEIHHLTSFKQIINETLEELGFEKTKTLEEYSSEELEILRVSIIKNNYKYGLGVCLKSNLHKLFHDCYGYGNNTPEQFKEFKARYINGEFKDTI